MSGLRYAKMHGSGNDFIMVDGRQTLPDLTWNSLAPLLCDRRRGIGADGIVVLQPSDTADFEMRYFNASGLRGEMCGNGARCAARFALEIGLAGSRATFMTDAGVVRSEVGIDRVVVDIPTPKEIELHLRLTIANREFAVHRLVVGVPHAVVFVAGLDRFPVETFGPILRSHAAFVDGCNANFIELSGGVIGMRTFERGVEAETLACGTGAVASAAVCLLLGLSERTAEVRTRSGDRLTVALAYETPEFRSALLGGPVEMVARGEIDAEFLTRHELLRMCPEDDKANRLVVHP
jgi:diaminopimelate epimerase